MDVNNPLEPKTKHIISLYVSNKPGVLIRIALVFARRGYNIDSLVVSTAKDPHFSRMTITATGSTKTLDLMLKQLNRLVDVINAKDMTKKEVIKNELAMVKINCTPTQRPEVLQTANAFKCKVIDITENSLSFQVAGPQGKIEAVLKIFDPYGIIEVVRSGILLIARGADKT